MYTSAQPLFQTTLVTHSTLLPCSAPSTSSLRSGAPLDAIVALGRMRMVTEGTAIHRARDPFRSVFYVKSGAAKRVLIQEDGREQILGFPMPGDIFAMEAISAGVRSTTVIALDI